MKNLNSDLNQLTPLTNSSIGELSSMELDKVTGGGLLKDIWNKYKPKKPRVPNFPRRPPRLPILPPRV